MALPAAKRIAALDPAIRAVLADLFRDLAVDAAETAQRCWAKGKRPMALYWKVISVYAKHIRAVLRKGAAA